MKTAANESVIHDWVTALSFQQQALLMTGMRGPDGSPKHCYAKAMVRYLRGVVLKPAGDWNGENNNDFMWGKYSDKEFSSYVSFFWNNHDEYPHHFIMHLLHCIEVVGYKHPDPVIRKHYHLAYLRGCREFHLYSESEQEMDKRLDDFGNAIAVETEVQP